MQFLSQSFFRHIQILQNRFFAKAAVKHCSSNTILRKTISKFNRLKKNQTAVLRVFFSICLCLRFSLSLLDIFAGLCFCLRFFLSLLDTFADLCRCLCLFCTCVLKDKKTKQNQLVISFRKTMRPWLHFLSAL